MAYIHNLKKGKTVLLLLAFLASIAISTELSCDKKESPTKVEDQGTEIEKDGVITIRFFETAEDSNHNPFQRFIDSLNISETENRINIPNAVPFQMPKINQASIWFFGDFEGMADSVIVWMDYQRKGIGGTEKRTTEMVILGKNQGVTYMLPIGYPDEGPVRGFVFALDKDNDNAGTGLISIKVGAYTDTLWINAAKNTICYSDRFSVLEFTVSDSLNRLYIDCRDEDSYSTLNDGAIWLVQFQNQTKKGLFGSTSYSGLGTNPFNTRKFIAYGFAPQFEDAIATF